MSNNEIWMAARKAYKDMQSGKIIVISGGDYEPAAFWFSDWNETINYYSRELGGAFVHEGFTKREQNITEHFENMLREGLTVTAKSFC